MNNVCGDLRQEKKKKRFDLLVWIDSNANFETDDLQHIELEKFMFGRLRILKEVTSELLKLVN